MTSSSPAAVAPWDGTIQLPVTHLQPSSFNHPSTLSVGDITDLNAALGNAATYLRKTQADVTEDNSGNGNPDNPSDPDDAGWDWLLTTPPDPIAHSTAASPQNVYGVTALGVYYAYIKSPASPLMTTMSDAAVKMAETSAIRSASDLLFLMLYDDLSSVSGTIYQDAAKSKFDSRISAYGSATALAVAIRDARHTSGYDNGIIPWDISTWAKVAAMLSTRYGNAPYDYGQAAIDIAEVLWQDTYNANPGYFDLSACSGWDPSYGNLRYYWYNLGVSGLIEAFTASNTHTSEIADLVTRLKASQTTTGAVCFCYGVHPNDEDWQTTAYAIMALAYTDQSTHQTSINHMGYWLAATQDASGGWKYSDDTHYPEIAGENASGISFAQAPMVVVVDDNFTSQTDVDAYNSAHSSSYVFGYDAFGTISDGIAAVAATGTVNILAGIYTDNLYVTRPVNIAGEDAALVTLYPAFSAPNPGGSGSLPPGASNLALVQANDVTISGLTLDGDNPGLISSILVGGADIDARNGIITDHSTPGIVYNNLTVHHCAIKNIYLRGIYASTGGTFNFHQNSAQNIRATNASIALFNFGGAGTFDQNTVLDCNDAISSNWSRGCIFTNNSVSNSLSGIHTDNAGNYAGSVADLIQDNTVSNSLSNGYGIFVFAPYIAPIVDRNTITNVDVGLTCAGAYTSVTAQFTNNKVDGMSKPNATGAYVTTEIWGFASGNVSAYFANNEIANCTDGIYVVAESGFTNSLTFFGNSLSGNTNSNLIPGEGALGAGTFNLQASGNWWGSNLAAVIASSIHSTIVDYTPWLDNGLDTSPSTGFQGDFQVLWVDDNSAQLGTSNRVQEAVDLVAGSSVNLMPGTYSGQVVVDAFSSLNLIGTGKDSTFLTAPPTSMPHSFVTSAPNFAILSIENSAVVNISDLTVDGLGLGNSNSRFVGIAYYKSGGKVDGCRVKDIRNTPIDGAQHGVGIYVFNDAVPAQTVELANTQVTGFQKGGIAVVGASATGSVHDCTVTGYGPATFIAMNGIQISNGASGSVLHNQVSGCSYTGSSWASSGILVYGALSPIVTEHNTVTECQIGINYINTGGTIDSNGVTNTPAGTGLTSYWNIVADPLSIPGSHLPSASLFDPPIDGSVQMRAPAAFTTFVTNNIVDGGGHGTGIEADAYSPQTLEFRAYSNWVTNFDNGIVLWEQAGATLGSFLMLNRMLNNGLGLYSENSTVDATANTLSNAINADDNTSGNYYLSNCWSDWSGSGPYAVGGTGGNQDMAPSVDCNPECCIGSTGNVDKSVSEPPDLSDLSLLVAYLVQTPRPTLPCMSEANVNASAAQAPDLSDLSLLIAHLIQTPRPALPNCLGGIGR
jgi:hypothetical protein